MSDLVLKNISIGYQKPLVQNINIEINSGKLIVLLGENGSGKSTLMKTLLQLIPNLQGEIRYKEKNIQSYSPNEWSQVFAAVFSRLGRIPEIQVDELMEIGSIKKNQELKNQIVHWLEMEDLLPKYANKISDGQLQKVMIARALMQDTPYVIFDEPTAHLDFKNKSKVFEILKDLVQKTGKTFIVISHEILHALYLSDEVWLIQNGTLYHGNPQEINQQFQLEKQVLKYTQYGH